MVWYGVTGSGSPAYGGTGSSSGSTAYQITRLQVRDQAQNPALDQAQSPALNKAGEEEVENKERRGNKMKYKHKGVWFVLM